MPILGSGSQQRMIAAAALAGAGGYFLWAKSDCPELKAEEKSLLWGMVILGALLAINP